MTRDFPNPIRAIAGGVSKLFLFSFYSLKSGFQKLVTPSEWNYGEQAKRDIPKIPIVTKYALKNGAKRFTGFFKGRSRGNDGPRK